MDGCHLLIFNVTASVLHNAVITLSNSSMKQYFFNSKIRRILAFLIIILAIAFFLKYRGNPSLPPQETNASPSDVRSSKSMPFSLPDLSGKIIHLSDFKGKVVLLNFFATWCIPCRAEMPSLEEAFQTNKDKGFVVLAIAADVQGKEVVAPFVQEYGLTFPVVLDPENKVLGQYSVRGIPVSYLLDRQGNIAGMQPGEADWSSEKAQILIERLLQESYEKKEAGEGTNF